MSEIEAMMNMLGITDTETRMKYVRLIERLDAVEMNHLLKKTRK